MYAPSNSLVNAVMRWPVLAAVVPTVVAIGSSGLVQDAAIAVAGAVTGALGAAKLFKNQICDCEGEGYTKLPESKLDWIIEYDDTHGNERPWKLFSMFGGLEYTKQHYASYSTKDHAEAKIEILKDLVGKPDKDSD
jgi:hypothetical protein